jgi:hypothetical protein
VCACLCARTHACVHVCAHASVCARVRICVHACACARMFFKICFGVLISLKTWCDGRDM